MSVASMFGQQSKRWSNQAGFLHVACICDETVFWSFSLFFFHLCQLCWKLLPHFHNQTWGCSSCAVLGFVLWLLCWAAWAAFKQQSSFICFMLILFDVSLQDCCFSVSFWFWVWQMLLLHLTSNTNEDCLIVAITVLTFFDADAWGLKTKWGLVPFPFLSLLCSIFFFQSRMNENDSESCDKKQWKTWKLQPGFFLIEFNTTAFWAITESGAVRNCFIPWGLNVTAGHQSNGQSQKDS